MTEMAVEIIGLPELEAKLARLSDALRGSFLETAVKSGAKLIEGPAKEKVPVKTRNLKRSIHIEASSTSTTAEAKIGTDVVYAAIQEFGGTIVPKSKPYLVFKTKDGAWHSVKSVEIPAHPYLRPAFDENKDKTVKEVGDALEILIKKVAS